jgi:hypothetical protein
MTEVSVDRGHATVRLLTELIGQTEMCRKTEPNIVVDSGVGATFLR